MTRVTRSRQDPALLDKESKLKVNSKSTVRDATRVKNTKSKSIDKNELEQDENAVPSIKTRKVQSRIKNTKSNIVASKLHSTKKISSLGNKSTTLALKSPVLRDRTNTTNELMKFVLSSKKTVEEQSIDLKRTAKKSAIDKIAKKKNEAKESHVEDKNLDNKVTPQIKNVSEGVKENLKLGKENKLSKVVLTRVSTVLNTKPSVKVDNQTVGTKGKEIQESKSQDSNVVKRTTRTKNISIKDVEALLNQDDEDVETDKVTEQADDLKNQQNSEEKHLNSQLNTKKFFKNKGSEEIPNTEAKRTISKKIVRKCVVNNDSTFSPKQDGNETPKPLAKKLRQRGIKDYCEISQIGRESDEVKHKQKSEKNSIEKDNKGVPIYKTIRLSQEKVDNKEEIYEFPEESQEKDQKSSKRKRVKKPVVKRAKKASTAQSAVPKRVQRKAVKKVQFKHQIIDHQEPMDVNANVDVSSVRTDLVIPEHLQNAGNSTIAEASTIKILSDQKLEGSRRISLTATPPIPKTINSELKLFGPKNAITSEPTSQYSNMVNHSLIRKSMSPITKLIDNFDTGSPWRPIETFSRIQRVVQSTPQINRVTLMRDKKAQPRMMKLDEKSICSEDTIHLSSNTSKLQNKEGQPGMISPKKATEVSPRKFGTVISNLSPEQAKTNINNNTSPTKKLRQSLVQLASPKPLTEASADLENAPTFENVKNTLESPQISPKKKFSTPSPFRFEKLRTSNRISTIGSRIESPNASLQTRKELEPEAGPSWLDKPSPSVLKQSNLNRFLNLDEMPKSACISTAHGIFDDMNSTPIDGKKARKLIEEANIDNAFGFDDCSINDVSSIFENASTSRIATEKDVKASKKGKIFPNARVKSTLPSRISENTVKRTLIKNIKRQIQDRKVPDILEKNEKNSSGDENEISSSGEENEKNEEANRISLKENVQKESKTAALDSISFLDTFDVLSENKNELEPEIPNEIPLFADLEPVHFSQPPRRSYVKRKRVCFDTIKNKFEDKANFLSDEDEDEDEENKPKRKKKMSKHCKEEQKQMQEWIKNINKTFEEVEHFDLIVE